MFLMTLQTVEEGPEDLGDLGEGSTSPEKWSDLPGPPAQAR